MTPEQFVNWLRSYLSNDPPQTESPEILVIKKVLASVRGDGDGTASLVVAPGNPPTRPFSESASPPPFFSRR